MSRLESAFALRASALAGLALWSALGVRDPHPLAFAACALRLGPLVFGVYRNHTCEAAVSSRLTRALRRHLRTREQYPYQRIGPHTGHVEFALRVLLALSARTMMFLGVLWIAIRVYSAYRRDVIELSGCVDDHQDGEDGQPFSDAMIWVEIAGDERLCRARNVF